MVGFDKMIDIYRETMLPYILSVLFFQSEEDRAIEFPDQQKRDEKDDSKHLQVKDE